MGSAEKVLLAMARFVGAGCDIRYEGYEKEIRREKTLRPCCDAQL